MMRAIIPWFFLPLMAAPLMAQESVQESAKTDEAAPRVPEVREEEAPKPLPWVGLTVGKLNKVMRHHATGVPEGVGFVVDDVDAEGPAAEAGVRKYDILWKMGDQLLINEAQFAALLRMRKAGDKVKISVVRSGSRHELDLVLENQPTNRKVAEISATDIPLMPTAMPNMPTVVTRPQDRTAELTRADGSQARLHYEDDKALVIITNPDGETIYEGRVRNKKGCFEVPEEWKSSVGAMLRSLYKARKTDWEPRRPRPRTVVPPNQEER